MRSMYRLWIIFTNKMKVKGESTSQLENIHPTSLLDDRKTEPERPDELEEPCTLELEKYINIGCESTSTDISSVQDRNPWEPNDHLGRPLAFVAIA